MKNKQKLEKSWKKITEAQRNGEFHIVSSCPPRIDGYLLEYERSVIPKEGRFRTIAPMFGGEVKSGWYDKNDKEIYPTHYMEWKYEYYE